MYIYIYIHTHICIYIYIYIYNSHLFVYIHILFILESTPAARTQIRSIRIEYDLLFKQLSERMAISQMAKFLHATEAYIVTFTGFNAWRSLQHSKVCLYIYIYIYIFVCVLIRVIFYLLIL